MTDWRKLAKALVLADGRIDEREVSVLKRELFGDNKVDRQELEFLFELRKESAAMTRSFKLLLFEALRPVILADATIDVAKTEWLQKFVAADGGLDEDERTFLTELNQSANAVCPEFTSWFGGLMGTKLPAQNVPQSRPNVGM